MKEDIREEKKKGKGLIVLVVVLLLVVIALVGYILVDKGFFTLDNSKEEVSQSNNTDSEEEKYPKELDVDSSQVLNLYKLVHSDICPGRVDEANTGGNLTASTMSDDYKFELASDYFGYQYTDHIDFGTKTTLKEEEVKKAYETVFGPNTYNRVNSFHLYTCGEYVYNATDNSYTTSSEGCGCITSKKIKEVIIQAKQDENDIMITTAALFRGNFSAIIYKDLEEEEEVLDLQNEWDSDFNDNDVIVNYITSHKDELIQYTYHFALASDGNYYYSSVEKSN